MKHVKIIPSQNYSFSQYSSINDYPQSKSITIRPDSYDNRLIGNISYENNHPELICYRNSTKFLNIKDTFDISSSDNFKKINITTVSSNHFIFLEKISKIQNKIGAKASIYSFQGYKIRHKFIWEVVLFASVYFFYMVSNFDILSNWMHNKTLVLMNTSGISDIILWTGFVLIDLCFCAVSSFIFAILETTHDAYKIANVKFGELYLFLLLASLAIYFVGICFVPLFNTPKKFGLLTIYYLLMIEAGWAFDLLPGFKYENLDLLFPACTVQSYFSNMG